MGKDIPYLLDLLEWGALSVLLQERAPPCPPALSSNTALPQLCCCVCSMGVQAASLMVPPRRPSPASLTLSLLLLWGHRESLNPIAAQFLHL